MIFGFFPDHLILYELIVKSSVREFKGMDGAELSRHSTDLTYEGVFRTTASIVPFTVPAFVHGTAILSPLSIWLSFSPFGKSITFGCRVRPYPFPFIFQVRKAKPDIVDVTKGKREDLTLV